MKINEVTDGTAELALWKLVSDCVWQSIEQRQQQQSAAAEAQRLAAAAQRTPRNAPTVRKQPRRSKPLQQRAVTAAAPDTGTAKHGVVNAPAQPAKTAAAGSRAQPAVASVPPVAAQPAAVPMPKGEAIVMPQKAAVMPRLAKPKRLAKDLTMRLRQRTRRRMLGSM